MWKSLEKWILRHEWIILVIIGVVVLRVPTLFEPYWYGDEGIYLTIGQSLRNGAELYKDIHDNKPPLLYVVAALADGNQFWYRLIAMGWNIATVIVFAKLAEKWFEEKEKRKVMILVVWVFAVLTNIPLLEGNIANAELFFLLPTLGATLMLFEKNLNFGRTMLAGVLLGLGGLFKIPAVVEAAVWPIIWWSNGEKHFWKNSIILGISVVGVLGLSGIYFASRGVLTPYLIAAGVQNVGYLSTWTTGSGTGIFTLKGRVVVVVVALAVMWGLARRIGKSGVILGVWGTITLFASLLSGRPYPHYLLQMAGVLSLAVGVFILGKRSEKLTAGLLITTVVVVFKLFGFYWYPNVEYYANFGKWMLGRQPQTSYYAWFNQSVNRNYEIAKVILEGSLADEKIFVWGDEPMIYALTKRQPVGRFTAKYHIKDFRAEVETMEMINNDPPKYIVSFGDEESLPGFKELLNWRYHLEILVGDASVYRLSGLSWWKY